MFAVVFEKTLLTDQGKAYVREYEKKSDAPQSIYRRISKYAIKSTKASRLANSVRAPLGVDLRLVSFCTGRTKYVSTRPKASQRNISRMARRDTCFRMQHTLFKSYMRLTAVKTQADQHKTQSGKELTYDQYVNLLLSAASAYEAQFAPKTHFAARAPRRAVYSHDITESSDGNDPAYDIDCALSIVQPKSTHFAARTPRRVMYSHDIKESNNDNDPAYDIDCALDNIQANGHPPGTSSMSLSQWTQFLSQDAKGIWEDKLPDEAKDILQLKSVKMTD
jgi:hypothetical protein